MCDSLGLASYNKLGVGFIDTGSGGSGTTPTLQQVTEVGASTDQPILFEDTVTLFQLPNAPSLATDANGKIIAGSGGGGATVLTKAQLDTAITNSTLTAGAFYIITDVELTLYGGTTIVLQATSSNTLGNLGNGLFYTPKYDLYDVWSNAGTYTAGNLVAWGGYVWENLTSATGTSIDDFNLDATNWQKISYNTTNYNVWWDIIKYDYSLDRIYYREDKAGNVVDGVSFGINSFGINPIKVFKWGFVNNHGNNVNNGYLFCINYSNTNSIYNNTLGVGAYFQFNTLGVDAYFSSNILGNYASFEFSSSGTLTQNISNINVSSDCQVTNDISAATIIYGNYNKTITKRQDGTLRLGYLDNTDTMVYVAVDA